VVVGGTTVVVVVGGSVVVDVGGAATVVVVTGGGSVVVGGSDGGSTVVTADDGPTSVELGEGSDRAAATAVAMAVFGGAGVPEEPGAAAAVRDFDAGRAGDPLARCDTDERLAVSGNDACSTSRSAIVSGFNETGDEMAWGATASWCTIGERTPPMSWPPK
jgi:hypothetical protein